MTYKIIKDLKMLHSLSFTPSIIIGFYSMGYEKDFLEKYHIIQNKFPKLDVIASSGESNIYNEIFYLSSPNLQEAIFVAIEMDTAFYQLHLLNKGEEIKPKLTEKTSFYSIILASSYGEHLNSTMEYLNNTLDKNTIFGAIAGGDRNVSIQGSIFYNGDYFDDAILLWCINSQEYQIEGISLQDFTPIGFDFEITQAHTNTIQKIDGLPALGVIEEIIGEISEENILAYDYPFFIQKCKENKKQYIPLSSLYSVDRKSQEIHLFRNVSTGDKLRISIPLPQEKREAQLENTKKYHKENALGFLFVCIAYRGYWGDMELLYLMHLNKHLDIPLLGFHSYGEIGPLEKEAFSLIQNQSLTLAVLSKKEVAHVSK
jgi:hypothetical protein